MPTLPELPDLPTVPLNFAIQNPLTGQLGQRVDFNPGLENFPVEVPEPELNPDRDCKAAEKKKNKKRACEQGFYEIDPEGSIKYTKWGVSAPKCRGEKGRTYNQHASDSKRNKRRHRADSVPLRGLHV
jgi:hypothetical protein